MGAAENIQTIKSVYEAFGRGDVEAILATVTDDVDWATESTSDGAPWYGVRTGTAGVASFFEDFGKTMEVDSFTIFTEANHGANGKTADWAILDSTPIDGAALPGKSVTGEYAFEGKLDNPVTIKVKVRAWGATAYFGG